MHGAPKAYSFDDIPKVSRDEAELSVYLGALDQTLRSSREFFAEIENALSQGLNQKVSLKWSGASFQKSDVFLKSSKEVFSVTQYRLSPNSIPIAMLINPNAARSLLNGFLGLQNQQNDQKALTSIESGILSYLSALTVNHLRTHISRLSGLTLELDDSDHAQELQSWAKEAGLLLTLDFQLSSKSETHGVKLVAPARPLKEILWEVHTQKETQAPIQRGFERISHLKVPIVIEVGSVNLAKDEISALEVDDIIVIEASNLKLKEDTLVGSVQAKIGEPLLGTCAGALSVAKNGRYVFQVGQIRPHPTPQTTDFLSATGDAHDG